MTRKTEKQIDSAACMLELAAMREASGGEFSLFLVDAGYTGKTLARFGHEAVETLLHQARDLLAQFCRPKDRMFQVGGKTFAVMLAGICDPAHATLAAEKIRRLQSEVRFTGDLPLKLDMVIGIASFPGHSTEPGGLLQQARIALEAARESGSTYVIYSSVAAATTAFQWKLQEELGAAIEGRELELHYQPKVDMASGRVIGAEALMRWPGAEQGAVSPDTFIPLAQKMGLMDQLTGFLVSTALRQAAEWPEIGVPVGVSVNLESDILQRTDVVDMIKSSLSIWGGKNNALTLEITERALMADSENQFKTLNRLRNLGVGISIDDFGTGYSSLSYFKNIPATELKIDKSFVSNMLESEQDRNIVESIIWLAHRFDLHVVAEGIEDANTLEALSQMDCDIAQGYFLSKPLCQEDFIDWLTLEPTRSPGARP